MQCSSQSTRKHEENEWKTQLQNEEFFLLEIQKFYISVKLKKFL